MNRIVIAILVIVICSCRQKYSEQMRYVQWVEDKRNGLCVSQTNGGYEFQLQYKPLEYIVAKQYGKDLTEQILKTEYDEIRDMEYYTLKIGSEDHRTEMLKANVSSPEEYFGRLEYCISNMQNDLLITNGTDTIPCELYHFERAYGLTPYNTFVLGFKKQNRLKGGTTTLIYDDKMLSVGKVTLAINNSAIDNLPKFIIN